MISGSRHRILWSAFDLPLFATSLFFSSVQFVQVSNDLLRHTLEIDVLKRPTVSNIYTYYKSGMKTLSRVDRPSHIRVVPWQRDDRWCDRSEDPFFGKSSLFVARERDVNVILYFHGDHPSFGGSLSFFEARRARTRIWNVCYVRRETFRRPDLPRPLAYT